MDAISSASAQIYYSSMVLWRENEQGTGKEGGREGGERGIQRGKEE